MRSSSNAYLSNLDHLRAFAAYMVFIWHFTHFSPRCPAGECIEPYVLNWPFFSLLEQGYSGVALFMCISGYIFSYLTHGQRMDLPRFWLNRLLRLFPLIIFWGVSESLALFGNSDPITLINRILHPQGAWTIYLEIQYYLLLPFILLGIRRTGPLLLLWLLLALLATRTVIWLHTGTVYELAYWTLLGRLDQFLLGMAAFYAEQTLKRRQLSKRGWIGLGLAGLGIACALFHYVNQSGGIAATRSYALWIALPTLEGLGYALITLAYLQCRLPRLLDRPLSALGKWSYSLYLGHFQLLPFLGIFALTRFHMGDGFYERLTIATFLILPMLALFSAITYRIIEKPFLRLRRNYLR